MPCVDLPANLAVYSAEPKAGAVAKAGADFGLSPSFHSLIDCFKRSKIFCCIWSWRISRGSALSAAIVAFFHTSAVPDIWALGPICIWSDFTTSSSACRTPA